MAILKRLFKKYLGLVNELLAREVSYARKRMQFFALLMMAVCILSALLFSNENGMSLIGNNFGLQISIIAVSAAFVFSIRRISSIFALKAISILYVALIFILATWNLLISSFSLPNVILVYVVILFSSCLIMPWLPIEVAFIGMISLMSYSFLFFGGQFLPIETIARWTYPDYFVGLSTIFLSGFICFSAVGYSVRESVKKFMLGKELEDKNSQILRELELAGRVHSRLTPKSVNSELFDIAVTYLPASFLSGDYAQIHRLDNNRLFFIICDVTGHGTSAALVVNSFHSELERCLQETQQPGTLLKKLASVVSKDLADTNMYLTVFCGLLDFNSLKFRYSSYGHLPQYLLKADGLSLEKLESHTFMLGLEDGSANIMQTELPFGKGDRIVLFTDGVTEVGNAKGEEFSTEKVEDLIRKYRDLNTGEFNEKFMKELRVFSKNKFSDDLFLLNIRIK